MLTLKNIHKSIKDKSIISDINLSLPLGSINGLLGPNGAGKTTTFYIIAGLLNGDKGEIHLDGNNVTKLPMHERSKLGIKYLPQEPSIFQNLTVYENLLGLAELSYSNKKEISKFVDQSIEEFRLSDILNHKGRQLSGGQRRKVEIARTLAAEPKIILLDEPFAGIDPIAVSEIQGIIRRLKEKNLGVIISDHNVRETLAITDRAYLIHKGELMLSGNSEEIATHPTAKKFYLGEDFSL